MIFASFERKIFGATMKTKSDKKYWVEADRLSDPRFWFLKAYAFASTCKVIWKECGKVIYVEENPELTLNSIRVTPYLTAIACELFMKGYLVYKGVSIKNIRSLDHDLKKIRQSCAKFGDKRFEENDLEFLTDTCGKQLMEDGGIKYPDKKDMVAFPEFKNALGILELISGEVNSLLPIKLEYSKGLTRNKYYSEN